MDDGTRPLVQEPVAGACDRCLSRTWLLQRLAGHLDVQRAEIDSLLALEDAELVAAVGGQEAAAIQIQLEGFDAATARQEAQAGGLELVCRCSAAYPSGLLDLPAPPAALHVAGGLDRCLSRLAGAAVAIVGSRRASEYGAEMARGLGRGLAAAGVTVVSGLAGGIDAAAHRGALEVDGPTVAVMAAAAQRSYPASQRLVHRGVVSAGGAISELGPTTATRRWMFPARNRIIAALAEVTVVVEARERSGALITARHARELGRRLGAVPGRVTSPLAGGPNLLLGQGAELIRHAGDVLEVLYGAGAAITVDDRPPLTTTQAVLLEGLAETDGDPAATLSRSGLEVDHGLALLAELELAGRVRRGAGGRFSVIP